MRASVLLSAVILVVIAHYSSGSPLHFNNPYSPVGDYFDEEVLVPVELIYEEPPYPRGRNSLDEYLKQQENDDEVDDDDDDDESKEDEDDEEKEEKDKDDDDEDKESKEDEDEDEDEDDKSGESKKKDVDGNDVVEVVSDHVPVPAHIPILLEDEDIARVSATNPALAPQPQPLGFDDDLSPPRKERFLFIGPNSLYGWHGTWKPLFGQSSYGNEGNYGDKYSNRDIVYHHGFYTDSY